MPRFLRQNFLPSLKLCWVLVVLAFACQSAKPQNASAEREFLWEAKGGNSTVYLMGSIHALRARDYPLPAVFDEVFGIAQQVVFEIPFNETTATEIGRFVQERAFYPRGRSIHGDLPRRVSTLLRAYGRQNGLGEDYFDSSRPWYAYLQVANLAIQNLGFDTDLGVDVYYYDKAEAAGKRLLALETVQFQLNLLASGELTTYRTGLELMLTNRTELDRQFLDTVRFWQEGNVEALELGLQQTYRSIPDVREILLDARNRAWIPQIESFLTQNTVTLVIAGAAHFPGTDGVIELLRRRGHLVEQYPVPPSILTDPNGITLTEGDSFTLTVAASGTAPLSYLWFKDGVVIPGNTSTALTVNRAALGDSGEYWAVVRNRAGSVTSKVATLKVNQLLLAPTLVTPLQNYTVGMGDSVSFAVGVNGTEPISYQWEFNGIELEAATNSTLTIQNIAPYDAGFYSVLVRNAAGAVAASPASLTVTPSGPQCAPVPPGIVSWWAGDGNANDLQSVKNGVLRNGARADAQGKVGLGLAFNGSTGHATVSADSQLQLRTAMSLEAWILHRRTGPTIQRYLTLLPEKAQIRYDGIVAPGGFHFSVKTRGVFHQLRPGIVPETNRFYHVVGTYDGITQKVYVDGQLVGSQPVSGLLDPLQTTGVWISSPEEAMDGVIDEAVIYSRAIEHAEVLAHYQSGSAGMCKPLEFSAIAISASGRSRLKITGNRGRNVSIYSSTNLAEWLPMSEFPNPVGELEFGDSIPNFQRRFYRAVLK